jgi:hypothetical protein
MVSDPLAFPLKLRVKAAYIITIFSLTSIIHVENIKTKHPNPTKPLVEQIFFNYP